MIGRLSKKLYSDYPELFEQKDWSMQKTCMCWGIDCGSGWYGIIDRLCKDIMYLVEDERSMNPDFRCPQFSQIKEKFGLLRIYIDQYEDRETSQYVLGMIRHAETASAFVCDGCGTTVGVTTEGSWIGSVCSECRKNRCKITILERCITWLKTQKRALIKELNSLKKIF